MRERKLEFPELENQLKEIRLHTAQLVESTIEEARETIKDDKFKDSCLEDANKYEVLIDPQEYYKRGIKPNNGTTLVRAVFPIKEISEHYHDHCESMDVEDGRACFTIRGVDIQLEKGGTIKIPLRSFHECEFLEDTTAVVGIPTDYIRKYHASLVS